MNASSKIKLWTVLTGLLSLLVGATTIVWADFGMPGWFFLFSQIWLWSVGLPAMLGVALVTAAWGIPGWTTLPLWLYLLCAVVGGLAFQHVGVLFVRILWQRLARRQL